MSLENGKTATITDVARLAGVSEQTVSRTVRDSTAVRPATKERVREAMRELGYRPSFAGVSLRRGRYQTIGIVMYDIVSSGNLDRLDGFATAAERHGYAITLKKIGRDSAMTLERAAESMSILPVDGMVFTLNREVSDFDAFAPLPGLKTVIVTGREHPLCSTVDNDQVESSHQVVDYLLRRGHKTVHFISGPERSLSGMQRERGWREALTEHGVEPPELQRGDWSPESGYAAGLRLADDPSCTAIYASNDAMAYGCMRALEACGKRVPDDVSIIGVDNNLNTLVPEAGLTSMSFDNMQVGAWAIDKIVGCKGVDCEREHKLFHGTLVERNSVRDLR